MKIQIMELESMQDLLLVTKHFVFKMTFGNIHVYYSGVTHSDFVGLNVFVSQDDYKGILKLNAYGSIETKEAIDTNTVSVIPVMSDTLLRPILANYLVNKFGITGDMIRDISDVASKMIFKNIKDKKGDNKIEV